MSFLGFSTIFFLLMALTLSGCNNDPEPDPVSQTSKSDNDASKKETATVSKPVVGKDSLTQCFNPSLYTGANIYVHKAEVRSSLDEKYTQRLEIRFGADTEWNSKAMKTSTAEFRKSTDEFTTISSGYRDYYQVDSKNYRIKKFAVEGILGNVTMETTYSPFEVIPYYLEAGESITLRHVTKSPAGMREVSREWNFHGIEEVTVPKGTFQACKVTHRDYESGDELSIKSTTWIAVGSGIDLKNIVSKPMKELGARYEMVAVLESATLNGAEISINP